MSAADMALVRETVPGGFNLAVGEPFFLQAVYKKLRPRMFYGDVTYPPLNGEAELVNLIKPYVSHQNVVVTNGAKQALLASLYALKKTKPDLSQVFHQVPYWPTYPTLAELSDLRFGTLNNNITMLNRGVFARIITSPNNPDGNMESSSPIEWDIWDAAYASPVYGWDYIVPHHRMSVWSAAKLFGLSGYRVGWVATPDPELARHAAEYVEKTTSGVSLPSQRLLYNFMANLNLLGRDKIQELQAEARLLLMETSKEFMKLGHLFKEVKGFPDTARGMFAWVQPHDPVNFREALTKAKVKAVAGNYCGADSSWFRFSLGVMPEAMQAAVGAVLEVYNGQA